MNVPAQRLHVGEAGGGNTSPWHRVTFGLAYFVPSEESLRLGQGVGWGDTW